VNAVSPHFSPERAAKLLQAVYFDVDATLVDRHRRFHPETLAAIRDLRTTGVRVGVATGRMYASALPYAEAIEVDAPLILYNGCLVAERATGQAIFERQLALEPARAALALARAMEIHANLYLRDLLVIERVTETAEASMKKDGVRAEPVGDLAKFLQEDPTKILLIAPDALLAEFAAEIRRVWRNVRPLPELVPSEPTYLEILPPGASKGEGLREACRRLRIAPATVVAFGDGPNDLEMLEVAGLSVAMGNAHPDVKAIADRVIGDCDSDAVGRALRDIFELV